MRKIPRPHQEKAMTMLRESLKSGKRRPIIMAPTGFGKTVLACMIVEGAILKGNRVLFIVPALSLVDQTVMAFYDELIEDVGVIQGNHHMTDYSKPVQVASIQTLARRGMPPADVVVVDECHISFKFMEDILVHPDWKDVPFIGLSASPWTKGLGKYWDDLIIAETTQGLIDKGFLSPFRAYAPSHPDLTKVKTVAGDYHEGQLSEAMCENTLLSGAVRTWLEKGEDRPTFVFAVDCAHAQKLQREFEKAGVNCGYIDAYTKREERALLREQFHSGAVKVVCSVGTMLIGIDWDVRCIVMCRPTKSIMLWVQAIGRGLRTAKGKEDLLILDHSDNHLRLGFVTDIVIDELNTGKKAITGESEQKKRKEIVPKECTQCTFLKPKGVHKCPQCGFEPYRPSNIKERDGELIELSKAKNKPVSLSEKQRWYSGFLYIAYEKHYKPGWAANQYREKFGVWPNSLNKIPVYPLPEISHWVKSRQIKFAHDQKKAAGK